MEDDMPFPATKPNGTPVPPKKKPVQKPIRAIKPPPPVGFIPPVQEAVVADDDDMDLLSIAADWTEDEKTYISERQADIMLQLGAAGRGSAKPLIDEVVNCDIQIKRLDTQMVTIRKREKDLSKMHTALKPITIMRKELMDRMIEAMGNLGIMPKDYIQADPAAASLSDAWAKYRKALDARRAVGWDVGTLGSEAKSLCVDLGSIPENYQSKRALNDAARKEILKKPDSERPPE